MEEKKKKKTKRKQIKPQVAIPLWTEAGGRCEFCNKYLLEDSLTLKQMKIGYIAHIVPVSDDMPRADPTYTEEMKNDISNLMVLCDVCHKRIDNTETGERDWPKPTLLQMKKDHEDTIRELTAYKEKRRSHVILYGSNIGSHHGHISKEAAVQAMLANGYYPEEVIPIELSHKDTEVRDHEVGFFKDERKHLRAMYRKRVIGRVDSGTVDHFSVFAFADQPLLIELGTLLSNTITTVVYQRHHDTENWIWLKRTEDNPFEIIEPKVISPTVALSISVSAPINNSRVKKALGGQACSIWQMRLKKPNLSFVREHIQLQEFRKEFTMLLDKIKERHGEETLLHVFPAVPLSIAVEIGRSWNDKAHLGMRVYDQNKKGGGFIHALDFIKNHNNNKEVTC